MAAECCAASAAQWAGWGIAIVALGVTAFGWKVRGTQVKKIARQKDIHDSIDEVIKAISEFEDAVYSFWLNSQTEFQPHQLLLLHGRIRIRMQHLAYLRQFDLPNPALAELRKCATMDAESKDHEPEGTANTDQSKRLRKLSKEIERLMRHDALKKSWDF